MRYEITVTNQECREIIAAHLSTLLHFDVPPEELQPESYGGGYKLGKYSGYEYPPKKPIDVPDVGPKAPPSPADLIRDLDSINPATVTLEPVSTAEVLAEAKDPPF